ncbi:hypothetical protein ARMSODRAFT_965754 [Armillaria solidipes]|uniref:Uncharacterized protein n=1 Tax=Armillaria solidipes TaxID=1076256 RepID=A0A2H3B181_9AGAR|nr:hypothetical protein ARMSODRAFT_965754 [Armillaria solidipes]
MLCLCLEGLDMFLERIPQSGVRSGCVGELPVHVCSLPATFTPTASTVVCSPDNDTSCQVKTPFNQQLCAAATWHLRSSHEGESSVDKVELQRCDAVVTERMAHSHHRRVQRTGPSLHDMATHRFSP